MVQSIDYAGSSGTPGAVKKLNLDGGSATLLGAKVLCLVNPDGVFLVINGVNLAASATPEPDEATTGASIAETVTSIISTLNANPSHWGGLTASAGETSAEFIVTDPASVTVAVSEFADDADYTITVLGLTPPVSLNPSDL